MESHYYEAYNQPNVRLVDLLETPVECITEKGVKTSEEEFELDMIVYATGFSASKRFVLCVQFWTDVVCSHWCFRSHRFPWYRQHYLAR